MTRVKNVRVVAVKLPAGADFHYAAADAETAATQTWADLASPTLTFTPSSAGDYFIMAAGQHHENPSTNMSHLLFVNYDGGFRPTIGQGGLYSANERGAYVPPGASDYLIIQSQWVYDSDGTTGHAENADFTKDTVTISDQDHIINAPGSGYQFASACISTLNTNASHTFENRYWSDGAINTYSKESVIYALRFP